MSESKKTLMFVYGTLKTGEPNYYLMQGAGMEGCTPRGKYKSVEKFPLVVASRYNVPYLLYTSGQGHVNDGTSVRFGALKPGLNHSGIAADRSNANVEGEVYEVDDEQLARMDDLEKHPEYYERQDITLTPVTEDDGGVSGSDKVTAQAYFMVKYRPELLNLPMIPSYADCIDGKKYVGPAERETKAPFRHEVHTGYTEPEKS